ncbi:hypothetical protein ABPG74_002704 [Tetrahymena malaccensis]
MKVFQIIIVALFAFCVVKAQMDESFYDNIQDCLMQNGLKDPCSQTDLICQNEANRIGVCLQQCSEGVTLQNMEILKTCILSRCQSTLPEVQNAVNIIIKCHFY